ncbi:hypothetical protein [Geomobilimonas luticola]|uniref:Glycosyltransferase RgtA/B/C/D-like domain-containing protein n=1 Tax=Geomobilimonas luticola TaxID=1114878 RepID=A0ABS5SA94_9BACT|nr:hypothetical protein [Geomobilimonas luticola]MBT0652300.1 hypothetical protein [Geomobilimonas luticola]
MSGWILLFILLVSLLQWYVSYPIDDDTAYHFSVGQLMGKHGILQSFPWTRFSWQFDHYADKEFLFHLLFVPLGGLGFVNASRVVGVIGGVLVLTTLYLILRSERVRYAGIWALLPLGTSVFVYRFAQVRPQLLSIALALIVLWAYSRGRLRILAVAAFLYPLTYVAFWQIPLILVIAAEVARAFNREWYSWKPVATLVAGIVAGVALHPNASNLLAINWIHMTDILLHNAWGAKVEFNMGEEFDPFPLITWAQYLTVTVLMAGAALVLAWRERKKDSFPLACALAMLLFWLLTIRTNRFLEYFVPLSALALAVATRSSGKRLLAPVFVGISIFYTVLCGITPYRYLASFELKNWYMEPEVVKVFAREIPVGAKVFTTGWEYTGSLLLNLPDRYYMVALDPTLLYKRDPGLYDVWYRTLLDAPADSARIVRTRFDSRFVVAQNYQPLWPFFSALQADPTARLIFANDKWLLFDLGEPPPVTGR